MSSHRTPTAHESGKLSGPDFVRGSALLEGAFGFTREAYDGARRHGDDDFAHSVEVARLLHEAGFEDEVVAAGLLHDVVEDTTVEVAELARRFGPSVADLVAAMTEDEGIEPFQKRKAEHRTRVSEHGSRAAAVYAADKLAKTRALRESPHAASEEKLAHYRRTVETLKARHPDLPFLGELGEELTSLMGQRYGSDSDP